VRRLAPVLVLLVFAAGCSTSKPGEKVVQPLPTGKVTGVTKQQQTTSVAAKYKNGDANAGKQVFETAGCKGCHTLKDEGATGTVGPNLDTAKPDYRLATARVTLGKGVMPSFKGQLSTQQIADVASYVVKATGGTP
jgi:mono/diheme cytochrome c family protein